MRTPISPRSGTPPWPTSSGRGPGSPPTGSPKPPRGRRRSTPRCGWRAGWRTAPQSAGHPCRRCSTGMPAATPGSTRPSTTQPAARATPTSGLGSPPSWPRCGPGAPGMTWRSAMRWPRTPATTRPPCPAPMPGSGTLRNCSLTWSCRWPEALLPGQTSRVAALAVLPTLTEVSRASLLCGELRTGGQDAERRGYDALTGAYGLPGAALFHKKPLDSSRLGYAVADDVAAAIADVTGHPLVTCVLNTIDDALDRSDPGGTEWGADAVKHLVPLLDRAQHAGRGVVLTADHGHIVERRQGRQRPHADISSGRSRAAIEPAADGEVLVTGRRVLRHDG